MSRCSSGKSALPERARCPSVHERSRRIRGVSAEAAVTCVTSTPSTMVGPIDTRPSPYHTAIPFLQCKAGCHQDLPTPQHHLLGLRRRPIRRLRCQIGTPPPQPHPPITPILARSEAPARPRPSATLNKLDCTTHRPCQSKTSESIAAILPGSGIYISGTHRDRPELLDPGNPVAHLDPSGGTSTGLSGPMSRAARPAPLLPAPNDERTPEIDTEDQTTRSRHKPGLHRGLLDRSRMDSPEGKCADVPSRPHRDVLGQNHV